MPGVFDTVQPSFNLTGMARQSHNYGSGIEAKESGMVVIGNPYTKLQHEMIRSQQATYDARIREMKAIAANASQTVRNQADRFLNDIDFMQESLLDRE